MNTYTIYTFASIYAMLQAKMQQTKMLSNSTSVNIVAVNAKIICVTLYVSLIYLSYV